MIFLLDQGVARNVVNLLREAGTEAGHIAEVLDHRADDREIIELARRVGATVVTQDSDFHAILREQDASSPSVIRIRQDGLRDVDVARILVELQNQLGPRLSSGVAISYRHGLWRAHDLPLA